MKSMSKGLRGLATATLPKMKAYAAPAELLGRDGSHHRRHKLPPLKGDFVPVYVAVGLIALSTTLGLYSATLQLRHGPNVFVKKKRRETIPEVAEPEHVLEDAEEFVKKSFFRRVAHIQDPEHNYVVKDETRGDFFAHLPLKAETLKDVGVEPLLPSPYH